MTWTEDDDWEDIEITDDDVGQAGIAVGADTAVFIRTEGGNVYMGCFSKAGGPLLEPYETQGIGVRREVPCCQHQPDLPCHHRMLGAEDGNTRMRSVLYCALDRGAGREHWKGDDPYTLRRWLNNPPAIADGAGRVDWGPERPGLPHRP